MKRTIRILSLLLIGSMASGQANAQGLRTNHGNSSEVKGAVQVYTPLSNEQRGGGAPTNDLCSGAVDNALAIGGTLSLSGDNTGATDESGVGFQIVYEQFTITTCADITLNYCVAGSEFTNFLINLTTSCPDILVGLLTATSYDNCTATFLGLPAGTYLIPVLADGIDTPAGAYTMEVTASACDTYCAASAVSANFEVINNVEFAGINNPTATTNGYENYTAIIGQVVAGNSYPITVTNTDGYDTDLVMVWIDLDQSGSFETSEMVYTSEAGVGPYTGQIAIPADALLGQTRMRLRLQDSTFNNNLTPCGTNQYGQVQDYTVNISMGGGGIPPNDLCSGAVDHALAVGGTLSLSGDNTGATDESGVGFQIVYEQFTITTCADITLNYCVAGSEFTNFLINLTTSCPDILVGLLTATSYDNCTATFLGLPAGTYLIPVLADGIDTPAGAYTMEVTASACDTYCAASAVSANFEVINNVQFGGIDNPTATTNGYENYTDIVGEVATGNSYPITVENTDGYDTDLVMVWIDLDQSGSFETSEMVYTSEAGVGPYTGEIAIPADALLGQTRMRLRLQDSTFNNNLTPCGTHQYGQVQDYTLNITMGVGMQEIGAEQFGLYPNPNDGNFSVVLPKATGKMSVEVVDVTGRVVFATTQQATGNEPLLLELAGKLAKGGYLLRITTADAQFADRMIVR